MDGRIASLARRLGRRDQKGAAGAPGPTDEHSTRQRSRRRSQGQVLVLFAVGIFVLTGTVALVIDVTWYWANTLKVQRAADAAALAGVIYLPGDVAKGVTTSRGEATKNGYTNGTQPITCQNSSIRTVVVTPTQDTANARRMNVTVSAPVPTFFMRIFGIDCIQATRRAKAEFVLPVPMGSPENYYGINELQRNAKSTLPVPDASGAGNLAPKGFWGGVFTKGANRANGDAFSPMYNPSPTANVNYDPNGYMYTVEIPPADTNGSVYLFDPMFCATSRNTSGGYYGTGDHWVGGSATTPPGVSTYYRLYNMNDTPYDWGDDSLVASSGTLFENNLVVDRSGDYGLNQWGDQNQNPTVAYAPDCAASPYHNQWWTLASGLSAGLYRLQVTTTNAGDGSINASTNAENMFGIEVTASGSTTPRIYGSGKMCAYTNLVAGTQRFYLAQIDGVHGGKTMQIDLFDPGDVSGTATMKIYSPYGGSYNAATFSYTASNGRSGNNVTSITTASGGTSYYNNAWITIYVKLPADYGTKNLTPAGEPGPGWWKIQYDVSGGNDTTTWMVSIRGNPVHLIVP